MTHIWRTHALALVVLLAAVGCSVKDSASTNTNTPASGDAAPTGNANRSMAYQHTISIETDESKVPAIFGMGQAACRDAAEADACVVLESHLKTGRQNYASLKFRAKPAGIQKIIAALGQQADVTDKSTTAEDLAGPIDDAAKKQAMLTDYRSKLEALRGRANTDVDALIKVNRELAQVQSDLEAINGKHAHLVQRVETETLSVSISSAQHRSFLSPIKLALFDFGANLSQGISSAITGLAYLLPWGCVVGVLAWGARKLWRRRQRAG